MTARAAYLWRQVVVNYASSAGAAEDVAAQIKASGGDAIVVGADLAKQADIERCERALTHASAACWTCAACSSGSVRPERT